MPKFHVMEHEKYTCNLAKLQQYISHMELFKTTPVRLLIYMLLVYSVHAVHVYYRVLKQK